MATDLHSDPNGETSRSAALIHLRAADILENVSDAFVALDPEWRIVYANHEACRINQKPLKDFVGKIHWEEWPGAVGTELERQFRRVMDERVVVHFEHRYLSEPYDVWLEIDAYPSDDGLNLFYRDISARKQAEQVLRQFQFLSDNANDAFFLLDGVGRFVYVNEAACRALGYTPDQFREMHPSTISPFYNDAHYLNLFQRAEGERLPPFESVHQRADGSTFPIEASVSRVDIGGRALLFSSCRDITERKKAEQALAAREESLRLAVEGARIGTFHLDVPTGILSCSSRTKEIFFLDVAAPTSYDFLLARIHEEDAARLDAEVQRVMMKPAEFDIEYRIVGPLGELRWVAARGCTYPDEQGRAARFEGVVQDITELKKAQIENLRLLERDMAAAERQKGFLKDVLRSVSEGKLRLVDEPAELPERLSQVGSPLRLDTTEKLHTFRHQVQDVALTLGLEDLRWQNLVTAVSEAAMNAVVHAGGGTGRVCAGDDMVQVWVEDTGKGISYDILPLATLEKGWSSGSSLGHGFWLMLNTVDRIWLLTSGAGTTVVIEQQRIEPLPDWLGGVRI